MTKNNCRSTGLRPIGLLMITALLCSCAAGPALYRDPINDPIEGFNRGVYAFNDGVDRAVLRPVAKGYGELPSFVRTGVGNFFDNLRQIRTFLNDVLQGKPRRAAESGSRFVVNTTLGLAGLFDPASRAGMPHHTENFAQTMAVWGVPSGPFLMLPFLGPSTVRDGIGAAVDLLTNPLVLHDADNVVVDNIWLLDFVDLRYRLLPADKAIQESLDPYVFLREAFIQRMTYEIWDGDPPEPDFEDEEDWDDEDWEVAPAE